MTNLNLTLPANVARSNFYQILDDAEGKLQQFTITLRGKAKAVIMSVEEFSGWQETLDIMSNKSLVQSVKKGLASKKRYNQNQADKIIDW